MSYSTVLRQHCVHSNSTLACSMKVNQTTFSTQAVEIESLGWPWPFLNLRFLCRNVFFCNRKSLQFSTVAFLSFSSFLLPWLSSLCIFMCLYALYTIAQNMGGHNHSSKDGHHMGLRWSHRNIDRKSHKWNEYSTNTCICKIVARLIA